MTEYVTPHLRTVLKTYQDSATKSLQGPGLSLVHPLKKELFSPDLTDETPICPPQIMPPEISQPILSAPDTGRGVLYETVLEGKPIGCFLLGGEMRLCFPQVLNNVLTEFTLDEINRSFDELRIFCSQCTPEQLNEFKAAKILPEDVKSAGLITRTNAERLCSALLHRSDRRRVPKGAAGISFRVYHRCFGKCEGICMPELYSYKEPACIECLECRGMFAPQKFVCHAHQLQEISTLHWGFDSNNWRAYLHVNLDEENREKYTKMMDELHDRQQQDALRMIHVQRENNLKRKAVIEEPIQMCKQEPIDIPLKKPKLIDDAYYQYQAFLAQYRHHQQQQQQQQQSAFWPWPPIGPKHLAHHMPYPPSAAAVLPYMNHQEPPVLQNPERVVRLSESERFERSFQPNVALVPRKNGPVCNSTSNNGSNNTSNNNSSSINTSNTNNNNGSSNNNNTTNKSSSSSSSNNNNNHNSSSNNNINNTNSINKDKDCSTRLISPEIRIKEERPPTPIDELSSPELRVASPVAKQSPPISPEGHSGSNEITSSTSPVPAPPPPPPHALETALNHHHHRLPINTKIDAESHLHQNHRNHHHHHRNHHHQHLHPHRILATDKSPITVLATTNRCCPPQPNQANVIGSGRNSEFELSTDTDDDSLIGEPDSSNSNSASWDIAVEALKDTRPQDRDKVLQIIKILVQENIQYSHENTKLLDEIRRKDDQIAELISQQQNQYRQQQHHVVTIRPANDLLTSVAAPQSLAIEQPLALTQIGLTALTAATPTASSASSASSAASSPIDGGQIVVKRHTIESITAATTTTSATNTVTTTPPTPIAETDVIRMPLKKSIRRLPESANTTVVVLQSAGITPGSTGTHNKLHCDATTQQQSGGKVLELVQPTTADG